MDFRFDPPVVRMKAGTSVRWLNADLVQHNLVLHRTGAPSEKHLLPGGGTVTVTFDHKGTYEYYCEPHPFMKGTVIVE